MNDERKQKYIYTDPIFKNQFVIAVAADRADINSFQDLQGKTTEVQPGVNYTTALENYNKEHPDNPVKLNYSEAEMLPVLQNVESGKYDFQLIDGPMLQTYIDEFGLKLKAIDLTDEETQLIGSPYSYLLVSKGPNGEKLASDIDGALAKLIKDGTIREISVKYFGNDYSPKAE
jgi:polar amino acid transport system substrate-binding protein